MVLNIPKYMIAMVIITGLYLMVEIPFSIHLVSILGGSATEADINDIERFGRLLTGIAVALAVVGIVAYPRYHEEGFALGPSTFLVAFWFFPIVAIVYFGLHFYGVAQGSFSSPEERKEAYVSNLAKRSIAEDGLQGLAASDDPVWLAMVSGMPALFSSDSLVSMSGLSLAQLARREAVRSVGAADQARTAFSHELEKLVGPAYSKFKKTAQRFDSAIYWQTDTAESEWLQFSSHINRLFDSRLPRVGTAQHARVIRRLRAEGVAVSDRFRLDDKATFVALVARKVVQEARKEFERGVAAELGPGSSLAPNSSLSAFYADRAVQKAVRDRMGDIAIPLDVVLSPDMDFGRFRAAVYPALLDQAAERVFKLATLDAWRFNFDPEIEAVAAGEGAVKATKLPTTALLLSLAGALFHIHKFSGYLMLIFGTAIKSRALSSGIARQVFAAAALVLVVVAMRPSLPPHIQAVFNSANSGIFEKIVAGAVSLQPGMLVISDAMAAHGPWPLIAAQLPQPRLAASVEAVAAVPLPKPKQIEDFVIPIPVPRPNPDSK